MNILLIIAAILEMITGLQLLFMPNDFARKFIVDDLTEAFYKIARIAGAGLFSLGVACWPPGNPVLGMFIYNAITAIYFGYTGFFEKRVGPFYWPVIAAHTILAVLFGGYLLM